MGGQVYVSRLRRDAVALVKRARIVNTSVLVMPAWEFGLTGTDTQGEMNATVFELVR